MASSKGPLGLSTGSFPVSARMIIKKAIKSKMCEGEKKLAIGWTQCCCTMYGIVELATNDTVKSTMMLTGSAKKPHIRVRLPPPPPAGVAPAVAAGGEKKQKNTK